MLPSFPFLKPSKEGDEMTEDDLSSILSKEEQDALPLLSEKSLLYTDVSYILFIFFYSYIIYIYIYFLDYSSDNWLYKLLS